MEPVVIKQEFRMPLDAEQEVLGTRFDSLDDAIRRDGTGRQGGSDILDRLMMGAVHRQSDRLDDPPQETP